MHLIAISYDERLGFIARVPALKLESSGHNLFNALSSLETQLDKLIKEGGNPDERSSTNSLTRCLLDHV